MSKQIGLIAIFILAVFFGYNLLAQITNTLKQADKLQVATQALYELELKNKALKKKLSEVKNPLYVEQEARNKLGFAKNGETVVVIPSERLSAVLGIKKATEVSKLPNYLGWWRVFF